MPIARYNTGKDISLVIHTPDGDISFENATKFTTKPLYNDEKWKPITGETIHQRTPDGWEGEIDFKRKDAVIDRYVARREQDYYDNVDEMTGTILETIVEVDGITQFQYTKVLLTATDVGDWEGGKSVTQKLKWTASRRLEVTN